MLLDPSEPARNGGEIDVGFVEHDQRGQGQQPAQRRVVYQAAVRVVGRADKEDLSPWGMGHSPFNRSHVQAEIGPARRGHVAPGVHGR